MGRCFHGVQVRAATSQRDHDGMRGRSLPGGQRAKDEEGHQEEGLRRWPLESPTCQPCDSFDLVRAGRFASGEHGHLQRRAVRIVVVHLLACDWLHDVVDVDRYASGVRPETVVSLLGVDESCGYVRCTD